MTQLFRILAGACAVVALLAGLGSGAVLADQVLLHNGDRLSGEVLKKDAERLYLRTAYAGDISIAWADVAGLSTDTAVRLSLAGQPILSGTLQTDGEGRLRLRSGSETLHLSTADVLLINPPQLSPAAGYQWSGRANLGFNRQEGNTDSVQLNLDAEMVARAVDNRITLGGRLNREHENDKDSAANWSLYGKYDHFISARWYALANLRLHHDEFQDLDLRTSVGVGMGYQFLEGEAASLSLEAGLNRVDEDRDRARDESYSAARWALDYQTRLPYVQALRFFHRHEGLQGLEDSDDLVIQSETGLRMPLTEQLAASLQLDLDWDRSPAPGARQTDSTYLIKLGYEW